MAVPIVETIWLVNGFQRHIIVAAPLAVTAPSMSCAQDIMSCAWDNMSYCVLDNKLCTQDIMSYVIFWGVLNIPL